MPAFAMVSVGNAAAGVTVSVVAPLTAPSVALITDVPALTPVASPPDVIVATPVVAELHVTLPVIFFVLLSL